jgi:divalent metal cation (Fe/Co/Zn/Cd) transporter
MFLTLLLVTFLIAAAIATMTALLFSKPIKKILGRLVSDELAPTWLRYLLFAIYVVGISGGVRVWDVEKYITPGKEGQILVLNSDRWVIEVYKTIIGTLQSVAWMLLVFFLFALLAYVVVRGFEFKRMTKEHERQGDAT